MTLLEVLHHFCDLEASDKRDIIYAALCLANDVPRGLIVPTPHKTLSELHQDVAVFYVERSFDPLDILGHSSRISPDGTLARLIPIFRVSFDYASWIPQWLIRIPGLEPLPKHFTMAQGTKTRIYNPWGLADITSPSAADISRQVRIVGSTLIAPGFLIDHIKSVAECPCLSNHHTQAQEFIRLWAPAPTNRNAIYSPTGETNMTAFLRLIVTDLAEGNPPTKRGGLAAWDYNTETLVPGDVNDNEANRVTSRCKMRNLAMTEKGYIALVFIEGRAGDVIFALKGGSMLYLLRPMGYEFVFVGECYVHGFMDGEAVKLLEEGTAVIQEVRIV